MLRESTRVADRSARQTDAKHMQIGKKQNLAVDWDAFDPWRIQAVRHDLIGHHLLQPDQLVELGRRLDVQGLVSTHSDKATAGTPFNDAPSMYPNRKSAEETLSRIRDAGAWMSLLNVQTDAVYRALVDEVLDELCPQIERRDPGMCYRGGWIFVTSPNAVTPFHIDKEHNFILQIRGTKTLYVWDHRDTEVVSEQARDRFHHCHSRDLIVWRDEFRKRAPCSSCSRGKAPTCRPPARTWSRTATDPRSPPASPTTPTPRAATIDCTACTSAFAKRACPLSRRRESDRRRVARRRIASALGRSRCARPIAQ